MEVIALIGSSGTGKSHRALIVATKNQVDAIIDDGLLIKDNKIIAGYSAKREKNKIQAVKRAIFSQEKHAVEVSVAIEKIKPLKLLVLGTSENMINKITKILNIPNPSQIIKIEEVATEEEISQAKEIRIKEGKHIIPVPTIELKPHHFSGYLIDPLAVFFKRTKRQNEHLAEKSIVRPAFSFYGKLVISDNAIEDITRRVAKEDSFVAKVTRIRVRNLNDLEKGIFISLDISAEYGCFIPDAAQNLQQKVKEKVEMMTSMLVREVNILVKGVIK
jgi:uncharacterized alkaline shock family protein YloU